MRESQQMSAEDDADLVSLCKKGSVDAFEELVKKHQKKMVNIAYRMLGNYEDSCEIVQDAFISAYRNINNFKEKARFSTWLYTIVINLSKNRLKQLKTHGYYEKFSIDDPVTNNNDSQINVMDLSNEPSVLQRIEKKDIQHKVQECINFLENEFKEVVILIDIQGFSYNEVSAVLEIPEGTVKSRLFRARYILKDCLKKVMGL
jgi:RNA polymerase sigma-70 factor (ECF subfamily)